MTVHPPRADPPAPGVPPGGASGDRAGGAGGLRPRVATLADAPALVDLIESAYRGERSRAGWTTEADLLAGQRTDLEMLTATLSRADTRVLLLPAPDGTPIACCQLERRPNAVYFGMFAVRPTAQGQGLGDRLLAHAEAVARDEWGATRMEMLVVALRTELIAFYERRGYRRTGRHEPFPYGDERFGVPLRDDLVFVVLEKDLGPKPGE